MILETRIFPLPGCVALSSLRVVKEDTNVGRITKRWKPIPIRWLFYTEDVMDPYTIGRLALPVVTTILAVSAVLTLVTGLFTAVKAYASIQRFLQRMEQSGRPSVTINIFSGRRSSKPPMQAKN